MNPTLEIPRSEEHEFDAAGRDVVVVDRSTIGRIEVTGTDRLDLLHRLSTNNLLACKPGEVVGTVFATDKGRIVDYVHFLVGATSALLLTSPANESKFVRWIEKYTIVEDIRLRVVTEPTAMLTLIGPKAKLFAEELCHIAIDKNSFSEVMLPCCKVTVVYRNEFETEFVDLITERESAHALQNFLLLRGAEFGLEQMRASAYETFRISRGIPALYAELIDAFNPYEVGLRHAISFAKGCYIGQEVIARLDTYQKIQRTITGLVFDNGSLRLKSHSDVVKNGEVVGVMTSLADGAIRGKLVGIGILKKSIAHTDDNISVVSDGKSVQGFVRPLPITL